VCAAGTLFDPDALYCDHQYKVRCNEVIVDKPQVYHGFIRASSRQVDQPVDYDYGDQDVRAFLFCRKVS
jgi:hypothetical protein